MFILYKITLKFEEQIRKKFVWFKKTKYLTVRTYFISHYKHTMKITITYNTSKFYLSSS